MGNNNQPVSVIIIIVSSHSFNEFLIQTVISENVVILLQSNDPTKIINYLNSHKEVKLDAPINKVNFYVTLYLII